MLAPRHWLPGAHGRLSAGGRQLSPYQLRKALMDSVDKLPAPGDRNRVGGYGGGGRLNVLRALLQVKPK